MNGFLATAGWAEAAMAEGMAMFCAAAIGAILGIGGTLWALLDPRRDVGIPITLGLLGLLAVSSYVQGLRTIELDHIRHYAIVHVVALGLPLLSSLSAIVLGVRHWKRKAQSD